jgi:hypothetical protein
MLDWALLAVELGRWRRQGRRPQLWWRDDDAQTVTPALARLVSCATRTRTPLALAVIPEGADRTLAAFLRPQDLVCVMQHGTDHRNGSGRTQPSQFNSREPTAAVARRLAHGWEALAAFDRRLPVYVPPWNDLTPNVLAALAPAGLQGVSAWIGAARPHRVDAHLDILRWRARPRFVGCGKALQRLRHALAERRRAGRWDDPVGLLTHHLDHDEACWRFLEALLAYAPLRRWADWRGAGDLFAL